MKRLATALTAVIACGALASSARAAEEFDQYRLESASASLSSLQAGAHADLTLAFQLSSTGGTPYAFTRDLRIVTPAGVFGNPQALPTCTTIQLGALPSESKCPQDSQVGVTEITLGGKLSGTFTEPVFNMPAPGGDIVARFGFFAGLYPTVINVRLDPQTYALSSTIEGASSTAGLIGASTTLWGVPAAPSTICRGLPRGGGRQHASPRRAQIHPARNPLHDQPHQLRCGTGSLGDRDQLPAAERPLDQDGALPPDRRLRRAHLQAGHVGRPDHRTGDQRLGP